MKILVITNMYPDRIPYFGTFIKHQVESLEDIGIEVKKVVKLKKTRFTYVPFILRSIFYILFKSYDLVHAHYGFHSALLPSIIKRRPLIITFHRGDALDEPLRNKLYFILQRFVVSRADFLIAVSNEVKDALINSLGANPNRISVITCGVDTDLFLPLDKNAARKELGISQDSKVILFVGSLNHRKGIDLLLECSKRLPEANFILIGEGTIDINYPNCTIIKAQPNHSLPKWFSIADIFILPSRSEGTPVVILEALSSGVPVIASKVGGIPDLVREGETGYLIESENIDMFEKRLRELLQNSQKRKQIRLQARKEMIENYDIHKIAKKIKALYDKLLEIKLS